MRKFSAGPNDSSIDLTDAEYRLARLEQALALWRDTRANAPADLAALGVHADLCWQRVSRYLRNLHHEAMVSLRADLIELLGLFKAKQNWERRGSNGFGGPDRDDLRDAELWILRNFGGLAA